MSFIDRKLKKKEKSLQTNVVYKENSPQEAKFRPYFSRVPTNCNLYAYGANNPVHYIDPTGMFNFETNTIEEGDTLSKIADEYNSKNGTNVTAEDIAKANNISDPNKIYSGNSLDFSSLDNYATEDNTSFIVQGLIGGVEILTGILVDVGITLYVAGAEAAALETQGTLNPSLGAEAMSGYTTGALLMADGINVLSGAFSKNKTDSMIGSLIKDIFFSSPYKDVGEGLQEYRKQNDK